jgi:hypothetical protein
MWFGKSTLKKYLETLKFYIKVYDTNCLIIIKGECDKKYYVGPTSGCSHVVVLMRFKGLFKKKKSAPLVAFQCNWKFTFSYPEGLSSDATVFSGRHTYKLITTSLLDALSDCVVEEQALREKKKEPKKHGVVMFKHRESSECFSYTLALCILNYLK